jgi:hypothetical protein
MSALCTLRHTVRTAPGAGEAGLPRLSPHTGDVRGERIVQTSGVDAHSSFRKASTSRLTCPTCGKTAQKVSARELYPFRDDRYFPDFFYVCCGNIAPVKARTKMRGYVSRRLRPAANDALQRLARTISFGVSLAAAKTYVAESMGIPILNVSTANARTCHQIIAACNARLQELWKPDYRLLKEIPYARDGRSKRRHKTT